MLIKHRLHERRVWIESIDKSAWTQTSSGIAIWFKPTSGYYCRRMRGIKRTEDTMEQCGLSRIVKLVILLWMYTTLVKVCIFIMISNFIWCVYIVTLIKVWNLKSLALGHRCKWGYNFALLLVCYSESVCIVLFTTIHKFKVVIL